MVEVDFKIVIAGIAALTAIETMLIICGHDETTMTSLIIGAICLAIGVIIPSPKIDNIKGTINFSMGCI